MDTPEFEQLLEQASERLTLESRHETFKSSPDFELRVREILSEIGGDRVDIDFEPHAHIFPDIGVGIHGVEVKFTTNDTWRSVANSIFETTRNEEVEHIYVMFGKMGGNPEVRWGKYDDCVMHVRTSHVPRFEVEMYPQQSLFDQFGISYQEFHRASPEEKMRYVREYARGRLKPGERLWWLDDDPNQEHTLSLEVRLYMHLPQDVKRRLRAEAALLCPQVVKPSRTRNKYNDAVMYILTYHGVLCPQARDLFSAGSVALRADETRGGNYVERSLLDIEDEMIAASHYLDDALFEEYWGTGCEPNQRIREWLRMADALARDWQPSAVLFTGRS